ncbi:SMP-30/gluconolactonase/LRE family protein [Halarchaeum sp. P4]|uniref:SMP-30/gluconolactonase/LRE family protein n=1 Tax=Halarchaeum sp. P4 TaxID=3421639 RepID=UPI003EBF06B5
MPVSIERVADTRCHTGEGPLWHPEEECLYWTDIPNGRLYRYDPASDDHECVLDDERALGGFTIQEDGSLLCFRGEGRVGRFADGTLEDVTVIESATYTRFNDVIAGPEGRVYAGTMPTDDELGRLYCLDTDGTIRQADTEGYDIPNGMGFTLDLEHLYVTESEANAVYRFDYDRATGELSNRRVFLDLAGEAGVPDGMTVDSDGDVWSARWNGGVVARYGDDGEERGRIEFPAKKVSCVTFAGEDYDTAYVTTALEGGDRETEGDGAGALFRFDAPDGVTGRPEFRSAFPT